MTNRERFLRALHFESTDRLPVIEWAGWWDKTIARWHDKGLPREMTDALEIRDYFGLDRHCQFWLSPVLSGAAACGHDGPAVRNVEDYRAVRQHLYPEQPFDRDFLKSMARRQQSGDMVIWITLEGFFWFPRVLLGIEPASLCILRSAGPSDGN